MDLSLEEKEILLALARNSIESLFRKTDFDIKDKLNDYPLFSSKSGAFVTLTIAENLRGCIGYIISSNPLHQTVAQAAVQAAIGDPRFPKLSEHEFDKIKIEISVLSEPFPMKSYDDIVIGKHGVILEAPRRALLLPQVPIEHNMDRDEFLSALCQKAGLYSEYWKEENLQMSLFTATVFSEDDLDGKNE